MERMRSNVFAPTHELIRPWDPIALCADAPAWVEASLMRAPWVVVRRGYVRNGMVPVGVRGAARHERHAAWVALDEIAERLSPEELVNSKSLIEWSRRRESPAMQALVRVASILKHRGHRWGPGGSVGFEIATGVTTTTSSSDLDLILRADTPIQNGEVIDLHNVLTETADPVRIDVVVETPSGGVSLAELAAMPTKVLVRTAEGPRLSIDPWKGVEEPSLEGTL